MNLNGRIIFLLLLLPFPLMASQINRLDVQDLEKQSEAIVLAEVVDVAALALDDRRPIPFDSVKVKIGAILKGRVESKTLLLTLQPRGVKDFDPSLRVGEKGVFFLKDLCGTQAKLTFFGSAAVFGKDNFSISTEQESHTLVSPPVPTKAISPEESVTAIINAAHENDLSFFLEHCDLEKIANRPRHGMSQQKLLGFLRSVDPKKIRFQTTKRTKFDSPLTVRTLAPISMDFQLEARENPWGRKDEWFVLTGINP